MGNKITVMVQYKNILLAEDDEDDRFLFVDALSEIDSSIHCSTATDGRKALQALKKAEKLPDILFLDINMPTMNGLDCLQKVKKDIRLARLPVVIFTTSNNPEDIELTHRLGANVFLRKPSGFKELKLKLEKILSLDFYAANPKIDVLFQYAV
jgi:CheY-like chemotaxis protein